MSTLKKFLLVVVFVALAIALFLIGRSCQSTETFTVTFDSNGGSEVKKQEVKANEKVEEPEDPTKDGYEFRGWYLSGKKYDFDKKVTKDIKLKARWNKVAEEEELEDVVYTPIVNTPVVNTTPVTQTPVIVKKGATVSIQSETTIHTNQATNFVVSVIANDDADTKVVGIVNLTGPAGLESLLYYDKDGNPVPFSVDEAFGGEEGFALADGEVEFEAVFGEEGEYEINIQLINVEDGSVVAETTTTVTVTLEPAEITVDMPKELVVGMATEFEISLSANDYAGKNIVGKAIMENSEVLESLKYYGADENWYDFSLEEVFGGEEGFTLVAETITNQFMIAFNTAGEYEITVQLVNVEDGIVIGEKVVNITVREVINPTIEFEVEDEFVVGQSAEFSISTTANDLEGLMVVGTGSLSNPEAIEKLEYYEVNDNTWYELPVGVDFGGTGFPLADASSKFRVTFKTAGTYIVNYAVVDAETKEEVASNETEITVREVINPTIEFEVEDEFVVGQSAEFSISTTANDLEGLMVVGTGGLSNPEAIEKLEYYEVNDNTWYELPVGADFGGTGFPLADASSKFRVTFKTAGTYTVNYAVVDAETKEEVASNETEITVSEAPIEQTVVTE